MKEHEEILNTKIDTKIDGLKDESSSSIDHKLSPLSKSDVDKIHNEIKAMTEKNHSDMKTMNDHISSMLTKLIDTSFKTENQEEKTHRYFIETLKL